MYHVSQGEEDYRGNPDATRVIHDLVDTLCSHMLVLLCHLLSDHISFRAIPSHMYIPMANYIYHLDIQGIAYIEYNVHLSNLYDTSKYRDVCSNHIVDDILLYNSRVCKSFHGTRNGICIPLVYCNIHFSNGIQEVVCIQYNSLHSTQDDIHILLVHCNGHEHNLACTLVCHKASLSNQRDIYTQTANDNTHFGNQADKYIASSWHLSILPHKYKCQVQNNFHGHIYTHTWELYTVCADLSIQGDNEYSQVHHRYNDLFALNFRQYKLL